MNVSNVLVELLIVLGSAALVTVVFQAARLPVVLGYVLAGLLIGPSVPVPLVADIELVHILSTLGVILLMFTIGLELRLSSLMRVGLPAALTALFEVALVVVIGGGVARVVLGWSPGESLFAGVCLGISSTMLVAKAFEDRGWKGGFTEVVFAILVFEDLIAIILLAVLGGVASGAGLDMRELAIMIGRLGGFLVLMIVGGLVIVPRAIRFIAKRAHTETLLIAALAVCFGMTALADHAGYSVALGAFVAGIVIAESGHGDDVFDLVRPFRDVLAMVFFVSVGMSIDPSLLVAEAPTIAIFTAVVLVMKPLGVSIGVFLAGHGIHSAVRSGLSLASIGELSFVVAGIGASSGVTRPSLLAIVVGVVCVTTFTSVLLVGRSESFANLAAARLPKRVATFVSFYESWLGRLRTRDHSLWRKLQSPAFVLIIDAIAVFAIVASATTFGPRATEYLGLADIAGDVAVAAVAVVVATPFVIGMITRIVRIARVISLEVLPVSDGVDLGLAPRRALMLMLELALALGIALPLVAATQPFIKNGAIVVGCILLALFVVTYRSIVDFDKHVRAGSELILELISAPEHPPEPLEQVEAILPGFGGTTSVTLGADSSAVGKTLAQLDLRAKTGATVLAIGRGTHGLATPSPSEPLRDGDVLALAGSDDAIEAAREMLRSQSARPDAT